GEASPHQNDGSRMGLAVFETNLHEIGFERGERALEPAAELGHGLARGGDRCRASAPVLEPGADARRERLHVAHLFGAVRLVERGIDFREVPYVRAVQDRRAQLDRLDRILDAMTGERAADEYDRREAVVQTENDQRIGTLDVRGCTRLIPVQNV